MSRKDEPFSRRDALRFLIGTSAALAVGCEDHTSTLDAGSDASAGTGGDGASGPS